MTIARHAQVTINGLANGQVINNILYYRMTSDDSGAPAIADAVADGFNDLFVPVWRAVMSTTYTYVDTIIQLYDAAWNPLLFLPLHYNINLAGTVAGSLAGPAQVAIIKFALDAGSLLAPVGGDWVRRSYIAMGPIPEAAVQNTGEFDGTPYGAGALNNLLDALVSEIVCDAPAGTIAAERAGTPLEDGNRSSMLIVSAAYRAKSSFRRSRTN